LPKFLQEKGFQGMLLLVKI